MKFLSVVFQASVRQQRANKEQRVSHNVKKYLPLLSVKTVVCNVIHIYKDCKPQQFEKDDVKLVPLQRFFYSIFMYTSIVVVSYVRSL